jgi:hypothetical protein
MKKIRYLKARLAEDEYRELVKRADAMGLTVSEYVRLVLARDQQAVGIEAVLSRIESKLTATVVPPTTVAADTLEPLLAENLLLVRELAAERNAQVLTRVAQKVNTLYPGRTRI